MAELSAAGTKAPALPDAGPAESEARHAPKKRAVTVATAPAVSEVQLLAATGGAELSCYRCMVPFGVVVLIAGVVVTAVAYTFDTHGSTISVLGLVLLSAGLLLLGASAACWKVRREAQEQRRRESQAALVANRGSVFV